MLGYIHRNGEKKTKVLILQHNKKKIIHVVNDDDAEQISLARPFYGVDITLIEFSV